MLRLNAFMYAQAPSITAEILLLSEDAGEVSLIQKAVDNSHLRVVSACPAVLAYLRGEHPYLDSPRPDLILLDVDLSEPDNCTVLEQIKQDPKFRRIPLIVLASTEATEQVTQAYDLNANAYIVKPKDRDGFVAAIRTTLTFWLTLARLPQE